MSFQAVGRSQKQSEVKAKHVLQVFLLLVICIWLSYQINSHCHSIKKKVNEESVDLGRKGDVGFKNGFEMDFHDGSVVMQSRKGEDGGDGDDELDRNVEEETENGGESTDKYVTKVPLIGAENNTESRSANEDEESREKAEETDSFRDENGIPPDGLVFEIVASNEADNSTIPATEVKELNNSTQSHGQIYRELDNNVEGSLDFEDFNMNHSRHEVEEVAILVR